MQIEDIVKQYGPLIGHGLILEMLPSVARGLINAILSKTTVSEATQWIKEKHELWSEMTEQQREMVTGLAPHLGSMAWFTGDWVVEAIKKENPGLSSLFLNWPEAKAWLDDTIDDIKVKAGLIKT